MPPKSREQRAEKISRFSRVFDDVEHTVVVRLINGAATGRRSGTEWAPHVLPIDNMPASGQFTTTTLNMPSDRPVAEETANAADAFHDCQQLDHNASRHCWADSRTRLITSAVQPDSAAVSSTCITIREIWWLILLALADLKFLSTCCSHGAPNCQQVGPGTSTTSLIVAWSTEYQHHDSFPLPSWCQADALMKLRWRQGHPRSYA